MVIYFIYCIKTSSPFFLDGEDLDNTYQDRPYRAYNPGIVPTSEGFRVELDSTPVYELDDGSTNYVQTNRGFIPELDTNEIPSNNIPRIPHPSHYDNENYFRAEQSN